MKKKQQGLGLRFTSLAVIGSIHVEDEPGVTGFVNAVLSLSILFSLPRVPLS